jgi:hypothetical protein
MRRIFPIPPRDWRGAVGSAGGAWVGVGAGGRLGISGDGDDGGAGAPASSVLVVEIGAIARDDPNVSSIGLGCPTLLAGEARSKKAA